MKMFPHVEGEGTAPPSARADDMVNILQCECLTIYLSSIIWKTRG